MNCYSAIVIARLLCFSLLASALHAVVLPPTLEEWKAELEARSGARVVTIPVRFTGTGFAWEAPEDVEATLKTYFSQPDFAASFRSAQALLLTLNAQPTLHLVLVNEDMMRVFPEAREGVIAHEFGHIWLHGTGRPAPSYEPGPDACLSIHAGDIVQHILIRQELDRRDIAWRKPWMQGLELGLQGFDKVQHPRNGCYRLQRLSLMMDLRLGLDKTEWPGRVAYLQRLSEQDPQAASLSAELEEDLRTRELENPEPYRLAVLRVLRDGFNLLPPLPPPAPAAPSPAKRKRRSAK
jgi:hypothetical protein